MELTVINKKVTMSTVEIAELTGKRHDHIIRDTETMLTELGEDLPKFEGIYSDSYGRAQKCYELDALLTRTLITGYSVKLRFGVIKRLQFLEEAAITKQPTMIDYAHALIDAHKIIEQQQPAVEFTRAMSNVQDSVKVGDLAKMLYSDNIKIGQNRLFKWLYDNKYLKDSSTPYQKYMDLGFFEIVSGVIERSTTGKIWKTVKVTGKGIVYITQKLQECEEFKVKLKVK